MSKIKVMSVKKVKNIQSIRMCVIVNFFVMMKKL